MLSYLIFIIHPCKENHHSPNFIILMKGQKAAFIYKQNEHQGHSHKPQGAA